MVHIRDIIERWRQAHRERGWDAEAEARPRLSPRRRAELCESAGLPLFDWCRFGQRSFERRTRNAGAIREACATWTRQHGSAVLCGPTGVGKTTCLIALGHRLIDLLDAEQTDDDAAWLRRVRFVRATSLVKATDRHPLGHGEPPAMTVAVSASLLLLDDLGSEGPDRHASLFEALDRRYLASAPTVVTTSLSRAQLEERYSAALVRRLTDQGRFIQPGDELP